MYSQSENIAQTRVQFKCFTTKLLHFKPDAMLGLHLTTIPEVIIETLCLLYTSYHSPSCAVTLIRSAAELCTSEALFRIRRRSQVAGLRPQVYGCVFSFAGFVV